MGFSVIQQLTFLLQIFGFFCFIQRSGPKSVKMYLLVIYKVVITISCLWPLILSATLLVWTFHAKSDFGKMCTYAELFSWKIWSLVIQVSLFRLAWKGEIGIEQPVLKCNKLNVTILLGTVILIIAKSASMWLSYAKVLLRMNKDNSSELELKILYSFPLDVYHTVACILMISYQCAWFCVFADRFETFALKLSTATAWRANSKALEKLSNEYQALCNSVEEFSSDFEVINSFEVLVLFINASFTGYFLLISKTIIQKYGNFTMQYFVTSLIVVLILLASFFAALHHLNKKVFFVSYYLEF